MTLQPVEVLTCSQSVRSPGTSRWVRCGKPATVKDLVSAYCDEHAAAEEARRQEVQRKHDERAEWIGRYFTRDYVFRSEGEVTYVVCRTCMAMIEATGRDMESMKAHVGWHESLGR